MELTFNYELIEINDTTVVVKVVVAGLPDTIVGMPRPPMGTDLGLYISRYLPIQQMNEALLPRMPLSPGLVGTYTYKEPEQLLNLDLAPRSL